MFSGVGETTIDRTKADALMIAALKKVKGLVEASPFSEKDSQQVLGIEEDAEKRSLMGLGKVTNTGVREVLTCDLVYVALTNREFGWGSPSLILKKGQEVVGEEIEDEEAIARLKKKENVWFMHKNFVIYKDRIAFPEDVMKKLCHFEIPCLPAEWCVLEGSDFRCHSIIYANPATPCDLFLKNSYFKGLDEHGLGTILIGVKLRRNNKMPIEQEYAELYPLEAEDLLNYLPDADCGECGVASCMEFAEQIIEGKNLPSNCPVLDDKIKTVMEKVFKLELPLIPYDTMMESVTPALIKIGHPTPDSMVLVTGNFRETASILKLILEATLTDAFLLITDTKGYSIDNAVAEKTFRPFEIFKTLTDSQVAAEVKHSRLIIPGLAGSLAMDIKKLTAWDVLVGPVSGLELPLYLTTL